MPDEMMIDTQELLARKKKYAEHHVPAAFVEESRGMPPPIPVVVTCFDARVIPEEFFNLKPDEVIVYRHVGGRINDYVILQVSSLGLLRPVGDVLIVHHTDCGATMFKNEGMKTKMKEKFGPDLRIDEFDFGAIADLNESVGQDVKLMRESPFLWKDAVVKGFIYDIKTGLVEPVD